MIKGLLGLDLIWLTFILKDFNVDSLINCLKSSV